MKESVTKLNKGIATTHLIQRESFIRSALLSLQSKKPMQTLVSLKLIHPKIDILTPSVYEEVFSKIKSKVLTSESLEQDFCRLGGLSLQLTLHKKKFNDTVKYTRVQTAVTLGEWNNQMMNL